MTSPATINHMRNTMKPIPVYQRQLSAGELAQNKRLAMLAAKRAARIEARKQPIRRPDANTVVRPSLGLYKEVRWTDDNL